MEKITITIITVAMLMFTTLVYAQETEGDTWSNDYNYQRGTEQDEQTREDIEGEAGPTGETNPNTERDVTSAADTVHQGIQQEMHHVTDTVEKQEYDTQYERNKAADELGKKVEKRAGKVDKELRKERKEGSGERSTTE